jgi:hypothetical protein
VPFARAYEFFLITLGSSAPKPLNTLTFMGYTANLEDLLPKLDRDALKVVLVIVDTKELGLGVRARIASLFREYRAALIPAYVGDIVGLRSPEGAHAWLQQRWQVNRPVTNPFEPKVYDSTLFLGHAQVLSGLLQEILSVRRVLAVYGAPGAGKTSSLLRVQAELQNDADFHVISCSGLASGALPSEFMRRAAEALDVPLAMGPDGRPADCFTPGATSVVQRAREAGGDRHR